jgi:hypothetical protein
MKKVESCPFFSFLIIQEHSIFCLRKTKEPLIVQKMLCPKILFGINKRKMKSVLWFKTEKLEGETESFGYHGMEWSWELYLLIVIKISNHEIWISDFLSSYSLIEMISYYIEYIQRFGSCFSYVCVCWYDHMIYSTNDFLYLSYNS